jgi:hypothetical protein
MTAPSVVAADGPIGPVLAQVLARAADPKQWERLERQMRSTGYCRRPVRLRGQVDAVDAATGERRAVYSTQPEPDSSLLKCCGNRREAVCPSARRPTEATPTSSSRRGYAAARVSPSRSLTTRRYS